MQLAIASYLEIWLIHNITQENLHVVYPLFYKAAPYNRKSRNCDSMIISYVIYALGHLNLSTAALNVHAQLQCFMNITISPVLHIWLIRPIVLKYMRRDNRFFFVSAILFNDKIFDQLLQLQQVSMQQRSRTLLINSNFKEEQNYSIIHSSV